MQNFPLISGQQKLPRGMKSDMSDVCVIPPPKKYAVLNLLHLDAICFT